MSYEMNEDSRGGLREGLIVQAAIEETTSEK